MIPLKEILQSADPVEAFAIVQFRHAKEFGHEGKCRIEGRAYILRR